jgi:alpha-tubulin suppressor-like RCC1 family protein
MFSRKDGIKADSATSLTLLSADASALAAGYHHTCALLVEGSIYCWGDMYGSGPGSQMHKSFRDGGEYR